MSRTNISLLLALVITGSMLVGKGVAQQSRRAQQPAGEDVGAEQQQERPMTARERAAARRAARRQSQRRGSQTEDRANWLARLEARGVEPWPEAESDAEHAAGLARSQAIIDEVLVSLPGAQLYETEHFLFTTNIPPEQVRPYIVSLDRMYQWMSELYGVPANHKVWLGSKAPIFAFLTREEFAAFEVKYFDKPPAADVYGLCHQAMDGHVVISCYRGDDPFEFGHMLVHETSHGFIHRYKSKAALPIWVNEGMAEVIGATMVPQGRSVRLKERVALQRLGQQRSFAGMFAAKDLSPWQYGAASSVTRFLLEADRQAYVQFIEALKEGMPWNEALQSAYSASPDDLLVHYGQWIGIADLRP